MFYFFSLMLPKCLMCDKLFHGNVMEGIIHGFVIIVNIFIFLTDIRFLEKVPTVFVSVE